MTTSLSPSKHQNGLRRSDEDKETVSPTPDNVEDTKGTEAVRDNALSVTPQNNTLLARLHSTQPKRIDPDSGLFIRVVVAGVIVAGLVAFAISFVALYSVAEWLGLPPWMWWAVPVFIDLAILVYAGLVLVHKSRGEGTWPSWMALGAFTALSVVANGAHTLAHSHEAQWQAYIGVLIAGMVPIAIFVATEQLSRVAIQDLHSRKTEIREQFELESFEVKQLHEREELNFQHEQRQWERDNKRAQARRELEIQQRKHERDLAAMQLSRTTTIASDEPEQSSAPQHVRQTPVKRQTPNEEILVEFVRDQVGQGFEVTGRMVAEFLDVSDRTGRRRLNNLKDEYPGLFSPQSADTGLGESQEQQV